MQQYIASFSIISFRLIGLLTRKPMGQESSALQWPFLAIDGVQCIRHQDHCIVVPVAFDSGQINIFPRSFVFDEITSDSLLIK